MKRIIMLTAALALLSACNTVQGMGRDLKGAVNYFSDVTDKDKNNVHVDDQNTVSHE